MGRQKLKSDPIDGFTYEVTQLGALEGRRLLVQLFKLLAPALGGLLKSVDIASLKASDLAGVDIDLDSAARLLSEATDVAMVDAIFAKMAETTSVCGPGFGDSGAPLERKFDDHFAGRYLAMLKWAAFALRSNYADFFVVRGRTPAADGSPPPPAPASASLST